MTTICTVLLGINSLFSMQGLVVLLIILLLFGGKKIPELMKGLGKGVHSFKQGMEEAKREMNRPVDLDDEDKKAKDKEE